MCRAQLWQWDPARLGDARQDDSDEELCLQIIGEELAEIATTTGGCKVQFPGYFGLASSLFEDLITDEKFREFLTLGAYDELLDLEEVAENEALSG